MQAGSLTLSACCCACLQVELAKERRQDLKSKQWGTIFYGGPGGSLKHKQSHSQLQSKPQRRLRWFTVAHMFFLLLLFQLLSLRPPDAHLAGTGKTTVARIYAELLKELGVLPQSEVVETSGAELASGGPSKLADALKKLEKGGVLFLDEAYQLKPAVNPMGAQASACIQKRAC